MRLIPLRFSKSIALTTVVLVFGVGAVQGAKVKVWNHYQPGHYDKAQMKQAVVSNEGAVRLSRQLKPFASLEAAHIWDVVEDKDGNLYVATGDEGKIFKVTPDGKASIVYEAKDSQVLCLALAADGTIYAGTGPSGLIVQIKDGKGSVLYGTPDLYVWSLTIDAKSDAVFAGTGPKGRIYRVTAEGKASLFYETKQDHVLSVAAVDGSIYAGTDKNGLVYRIDDKGKGFVLFQAPQSEVRRLLVTPDAVYAITSAPGRKRGPGSSTSGEAPSGTRVAGVLDAGGPAPARTSSEGAGGTSGSAPAPKEKEPDKSNAAPATAPPSTGENSLFRIAADGTARELFREKALLLSLLRHDGRIYVGAGLDGQLFEVQESSREKTEIARLDHGQIQVLCKRKDGSILIGADDPGKLYLLQDKFVAKGTITSEVLDAKLLSRWGALSWKGDLPAGTRITVAVRSGNLSEPDDTWSAWSAQQTDAEKAVASAPAARYLQYRVTLETDDASKSPALRGLTIRYATANQTPELTAIETPDLDAGNLKEPKRLKFKWTATDVNEDDLTFSLYVRKDGWKNWILIEEDIDKAEYEWDTTATPSGIYQLKVVASDRKDNPDGESLAAERTSAPFPVAHTPPTVTVKIVGIEGDQAIVEATASHSLVRLTAGSFALNGKKWINVFPTDGLFDSKSETFRFKTDALKPGTYVLVLRIKDAAGNTGSGDVVFNVKNDDK